jgi:hypothetical protein
MGTAFFILRGIDRPWGVLSLRIAETGYDGQTIILSP